MQQHYDFILFESCHAAIHHKYDVILIARMLHSQGLKVAILNIYNDFSTSHIHNIPIINLPFHQPIPNDAWQSHPKNKLHSLFCNFRFLLQQHNYAKRVIKFIEPLADQFYCGSFNYSISSQYFKINKPCYFWGLRSSWFTGFRKLFFKKPIACIRMMILRHAFMINTNHKLFVSNPIIKTEFEKLGVDKSRIIIREERCIEGEIVKEEDNIAFGKGISFLVIGMLRKEKNIPFTISAFKAANIPASTLTLVGRSNKNEYEDIITKSIDNDKRIVRINRYLEYQEFNYFFKQSQFILFADNEGNSCITNGTMMEALINRRPIICPNYNPYTYYITKYNIGILYQPNNIASYADALRKANELGYRSFLPTIDHFLKTISFEHVAQQLVSDIMKRK